MTPEESKHIDDAVNNAVQAYLADTENFQLDLDALDLRIHLTGSKWSGVVDKPVAKFLLDLDRRVNEELARVGVELPQSKHGLLALRIEDGSLEAFLQYSKGILSEVQKMKPREQILVLVTILGVFGIWKSPDIIKALEDGDIEAVK